MAASEALHIYSAGDVPEPAWGPGLRMQLIPRRMSTAAEGALVAAVLTLCALGIHGYHPFAEDGGLYVCSILKAMHPSLYAAWGEFATVQMRYSLFAPLLAGLIHFSRLPLPLGLFLLHVLSIWATIFAGWLIAGCCYASRQSCVFGKGA